MRRLVLYLSVPFFFACGSSPNTQNDQEVPDRPSVEALTSGNVRLVKVSTAVSRGQMLPVVRVARRRLGTEEVLARSLALAGVLGESPSDKAGMRAWAEDAVVKRFARTSYTSSDGGWTLRYTGYLDKLTLDLNRSWSITGAPGIGIKASRAIAKQVLEEAAEAGLIRGDYALAQSAVGGIGVETRAPVANAYFFEFLAVEAGFVVPQSSVKVVVESGGEVSRLDIAQVDTDATAGSETAENSLSAAVAQGISALDTSLQRRAPNARIVLLSEPVPSIVIGPSEGESASVLPRALVRWTSVNGGASAKSSLSVFGLDSSTPEEERLHPRKRDIRCEQFVPRTRVKAISEDKFIVDRKYVNSFLGPERPLEFCTKLRVEDGLVRREGADDFLGIAAIPVNSEIGQICGTTEGVENCYAVADIESPLPIALALFSSDQISVTYRRADETSHIVTFVFADCPTGGNLEADCGALD